MVETLLKDEKKAETEVDKKDPKEMRMYQLSYIFPAQLNAEEILRARDEISENLARGGAHILGSKDPMKKKLAYPIAKQSYGFMGEMTFWASPASVSVLSDAFRQHERLLRFSLTGYHEPKRIPDRRHERVRTHTADSTAKDGQINEQREESGEQKIPVEQKTEQQPRTFKEKISLQEIDKKLEEIMKSI
jgi:small subunit ribosomal protein S6